MVHSTVETPVSGHPREAEQVSASRAGHLWECVNFSKFKWGFVKAAVHISRAVRLQECPLREL